MSRNDTAWADFDRELRAEADQLFKVDVPRAVVGLARELRNELEGYTPRGATGKRKGSWAGGKAIDVKRSEGSDAQIAEELADWKIGEPIVVYSNSSVAYWLDKGTEKMRARPIVIPALQAVALREVKL